MNSSLNSKQHKQCIARCYLHLWWYFLFIKNTFEQNHEIALLPFYSNDFLIPLIWKYTCIKMHFLKTKVDKTEWAVALFLWTVCQFHWWNRLLNDFDAHGARLEKAWHWEESGKNIFTRSRKFGNKINAQVKRTPHAKFIIHLLGAKIQPLW